MPIAIEFYTLTYITGEARDGVVPGTLGGLSFYFVGVGLVDCWWELFLYFMLASRLGRVTGMKSKVCGYVDW